MGAEDKDILHRLTRREALGVLGAGSGVGLLAMLRAQREILAELAVAGSKKKVTFPKGAIVRTILKDIPPEELASGATLFHEHLSVDISGIAGGVVSANAPPPPPNPRPPRPIPSMNVDLIVEELNAAQKDGLGCIVDAGHTDMRRFLENIQIIASRTKVHVVASGGYYMNRAYPPNIETDSEDQIAEDLVTLAKIDRYGAFGEIGADPDEPELKPNEVKVFHAVGKAHLKTNLPILTHNAYGTGPNVPADAGLRQLDAFESVGVNPKRVAIGHMCCLDDPMVVIIKQIAKRGAFVGFDRVTELERLLPDEKRVKMVLAFLDAGYQDNLLFSSDFGGNLTVEEQPGYSRVITTFVPKLRAAGVNDDVIHSILYDNPRRFLAFEPKKA
jgi:phosphotriesterase-related protein